MKSWAAISEATMGKARAGLPVLLATIMPLLAACGGDDDCTTTTTRLAGLCPDPVVVQTDWNPEAEHGGLYQLVGPNPNVNTVAKKVTAPLMDGDVNTGVRIEIRIGGPAVGFEQVSSLMYRDPSITLGYVFTDEAIQNSSSKPTRAIIAALDISPQMIMWDPQTYPTFHTIADIGQTNTRVVYGAGATYMEYLVGAGILQRGQVDGTYDGTPTQFVSAGGRV